MKLSEFIEKYGDIKVSEKILKKRLTLKIGSILYQS